MHVVLDYLFISFFYSYPFAAFLYGVALNHCSCSVTKEKLKVASNGYKNKNFNLGAVIS